jgi:tetratricopeptide (TPR) repeat protein
MAVDVSKLVQKAHNAIERRNYGLALISYKQALTLQPENIDARINLRATQNRNFAESGGSKPLGILKAVWPLLKAQVLQIAGKHEQAILACEDALTQYPGLTYAMKLLAKSAVKLEWYELAVWQMNEILQKYDPENVNIMYEQVEVLESLDRVQEAIELCDKIRELDPAGEVDGLIRELAARQTATVFEKGAEEGARAIVKSSDETEFLEADERRARTDEQREKKVQGFLKQLEERPDDYRLYLRMGDEYYNFDDFEAGYPHAKEAYEKAAELMPSDHNIKAKLGDLEIKRLRLRAQDLKAKAEAGDEQAREEFKKAYKELKIYQIQEYEHRVKAQPLIAAYHHTLGRLYLETKQYDKAVAEFQQSCKDPKYAIDAYTCLGQCFAAMDQLDLALDMFRRAMEGSEVFAKIRDAVYYYADALEQDGQDREALKQFQRIFEDDINYKDIRQRVETVRQRIKAEGEEPPAAPAAG